MVKVHQWDAQALSNFIKMMMVKLAHFSAPVLFIFLKVQILRMLKCFFIKLFLVLIWSSGFRLYLQLDLFDYQSLLLVQLLKLNISQLLIVAKFMQKNIKVLCSSALLKDWLHFIWKTFYFHSSHRGILVVEHRKILITLHFLNRSILKYIIKFSNQEIIKHRLIPDSIDIQQVFKIKIEKKMSKINKSHINITSPKGSLLAEINNLKKELKDLKQGKKQEATILHEKSLKQLSSHMRKSSPTRKSSPVRKFSKQKYSNSITPLNSTTKDEFFKAKKQEFISPSKTVMPYICYTDDNSQIDKRQLKSKKQNFSHDKQDEIVLNELCFKEKDRKLKMDIEINKLRKIILRHGSSAISNQVNYIISLINTVIKQMSSKLQYFQKNQKNSDTEQDLLIKRQQHEIELLSQKICELQQQIKDLHSQIKCKQQKDESFIELKNLSIYQNSQFRSHTQNLQNQVNQYQAKCLSLEEENKIFTIKLQKKQQQLLMLQQDVNYLRIQTQNFKQQKSQINDLYENLNQQFRDFKRSKTIELQKIDEQKLKWEKQCKLRRNQSQQIQQIQQCKLSLMKQVKELRKLCQLKTKQLEDKKTIMHQNQRKVLQLQTQIYRYKSQNQTLKNQNQFSLFQISKLKEEMQDLRRYGSLKNSSSNQKIHHKNESNIPNMTIPSMTTNLNKPKINIIYDDMAKGQQMNNSVQKQNIDSDFIYESQQNKKEQFSKSLKQKQDKLKALDDIHSMIKKHKNEMHI